MPRTGLERTTWVATYAAFIPEKDLRIYFDEHYSAEALRRWMADQDNLGYLAIHEGIPAGYVRTRMERASDRFYVSSLYVLPEAQGSGLGGKLMEVSALRAAGAGVDRIWLGVMEQNVRTLAWYRKQGFQFIEQAPFLMGSSTVNHLIGYKLIHRDTK